MASIEAIADWLSAPLIGFVLVLTRLSVMMMAIPAIGSGIPMRVRAILAIGIALMLLPLVQDSSPWTSERLAVGSFLDLVIAVAREAALGMLIGLVIRLLVSGMQMAGELASNAGGMQLGDSIDPDLNMSVSTLGRLVSLMVTAAMFLMGGHRMMIESLLESFRAMPPGNVRFEVGMMELVLFEFRAGIEAGIRTGAPLVAALLLANLVTGLISRTLPQLNLLAIGLPFNGLILLVVSGFSLSCGIWVFHDSFLAAIERLTALW